jgi:2-hydroxychromene-2-carboxylate isomerase
MTSVVLYFDYASPYSYITSELLARALPRVAVELRPIYLRGLESFASGVPYSGSKLAYLARDVARTAEFHGVPLQPPYGFPVDGLHALRAAYVARDHGALERFHPAMFRAAWAERRDVMDKEVVAGILADAIGGVPTAPLLEAMAAQPNKDRLRAATNEAVLRGVFGAPTFFVGDEMYWGHDRLDQVARAAGVTSSTATTTAS